MCEKNADKIYEEIVLTGMMQTTFIPAILLQTPTNVQLIESSKKCLKRSIHFQN